jgi:acyl-homoserine lactone synthase
MICIVNGENRERFQADLREMHRQRKRAFVDGAGWNVPVVGDLEIDAYDRIDTTYLIAKGHPTCSDVLASCRLLPTTHSHLMSDLFMSACADLPPRGPLIWEASRFCVSSRVTTRRARLALLWEMICGVSETALLLGAEQIIFVANAALLPLTLRCGWQARRLGPTLPDGRDEITAVAVAVTANGLRNVRRRFGIAGPVACLPVPTAQIAA